jgi:hypothetical protein
MKSVPSVTTVNSLVFQKKNLKNGILRYLMFETTMPNVEIKARIALKYVTRSFFFFGGGGYRKQNYKNHFKPHAEQI